MNTEEKKKTQKEHALPSKEDTPVPISLLLALRDTLYNSFRSLHEYSVFLNKNKKKILD